MHVEWMNAAWNFRREHLPLTQRSHHVITNGGGQPNIVPGEASVWYYFRDKDFASVRTLYETGNEISEAAAKATPAAKPAPVAKAAPAPVSEAKEPAVRFRAKGVAPSGVPMIYCTSTSGGGKDHGASAGGKAPPPKTVGDVGSVFKAAGGSASGGKSAAKPAASKPTADPGPLTRC